MRARAVACAVVLAALLLGALTACTPGAREQRQEASDTSTTSTEKPTVPPAPDRSSDSRSVWPSTVAVGGLALLLGVGLGVGLAGRLRPARPGAAARPVQAATRAVPVPGPEPGLPANPQPLDRPLVDGLIAVADVADSAAVQAQVRVTLQRVGVLELDATPGERFDPGRHNAVGSVPTADPARDMTIARVVRRGWTTPTTVIRPTDVEVGRYRGGPS